MAGRGRNSLTFSEVHFDAVFPNVPIRIHYANHFANFDPPLHNDFKAYAAADKEITTMLAAANKSCPAKWIHIPFDNLVPHQTKDEYRYIVIVHLLNWNIQRLSILDDPTADKVMVISINRNVRKGVWDGKTLVAPPEESEAGISQIFQQINYHWEKRDEKPKFADYISDVANNRISLRYAAPETRSTELMLPTDRITKQWWFGLPKNQLRLFHPTEAPQFLLTRFDNAKDPKILDANAPEFNLNSLPRPLRDTVNRFLVLYYTTHDDNIPWVMTQHILTCCCGMFPPAGWMGMGKGSPAAEKYFGFTHDVFVKKGDNWEIELTLFGKELRTKMIKEGATWTPPRIHPNLESYIPYRVADLLFYDPIRFKLFFWDAKKRMMKNLVQLKLRRIEEATIDKFVLFMENVMKPSEEDIEQKKEEQRDRWHECTGHRCGKRRDKKFRDGKLIYESVTDGNSVSFYEHPFLEGKGLCGGCYLWYLIGYFVGLDLETFEQTLHFSRTRGSESFARRGAFTLQEKWSPVVPCRSGSQRLFLQMSTAEMFPCERAFYLTSPMCKVCQDSMLNLPEFCDVSEKCSKAGEDVSRSDLPTFPSMAPFNPRTLQCAGAEGVNCSARIMVQRSGKETSNVYSVNDSNQVVCIIHAGQPQIVTGIRTLSEPEIDLILASDWAKFGGRVNFAKLCRGFSQISNGRQRVGILPKLLLQRIEVTKPSSYQLQASIASDLLDTVKRQFDAINQIDDNPDLLGIWDRNNVEPNLGGGS